ncbi:hypothetical protein RZO55_09705 [Clostridium boliviensis]|uniref:Uncharacterized protein n=1 Tax=Clostridium boliviensis TaxID=318465 RepID=A0ABU4GJP9_9CLOT|nr:hypothetical protein [Clostridium boliviensis]MDW2797846.1 hypothetical protein [Clostridium boliviensis]
MNKEDSSIWKEGKRTQYLEGLKRYRNKGVSIVIDGEELPETDWERIFEIREDDSFYMADYVPDEVTGKLQEIRFDRVYNR